MNKKREKAAKTLVNNYIFNVLTITYLQVKLPIFFSHIASTPWIAQHQKMN
jgi:hypothetical protein